MSSIVNMVDPNPFPWAGGQSAQSSFNPLKYLPPNFWGVSSGGGGGGSPTIGSVSAAGNTQGTATLLPDQINVVNGGTGGVILNPAIGAQYVFARAGSTINVYPPSGAQIETQGSNVAATLANGTFALFFPTSATQWYSM